MFRVLRPCFLGLGFTVFTVPTASKQGLRPCTPAPAAGFRLRRAMLDPACGVLPEATRRARRTKAREGRQGQKETKNEAKEDQGGASAHDTGCVELSCYGPNARYLAVSLCAFASFTVLHRKADLLCLNSLFGFL